MQVTVGMEPGGSAPSRSARAARLAWPFVLTAVVLSTVGSLAWGLAQRFGSLFTGEPVRFGFWPGAAQEQSWPWLVVASLPLLVGLTGLTLACRRRGAGGAWRAARIPVAVTLVGMLVFVAGVVRRADLLVWSAVAWIAVGTLVLVLDRHRWGVALLVTCAVLAGAVGRLVGIPWPLVGGPQALAVRSYELASVAASPDGRYLATVTGFGDLELDDRVSGTVSHRRLDQGSAWVRFSADGRRLSVLTYQGNAYTWDVVSGAWGTVDRSEGVETNATALAADGTVVAVRYGGDAVVQHLSTGTTVAKRLSSLRASQPVGGGPLPSAAGLSADGRVAVVGYDDGQVVAAQVGEDRRLLMLDAPPAGGRQVWVPYKDVPEGAVSAVAVTPDARTLALATADGRLRLVDVASGVTRVELHRSLLSGDVGRALALEFSADGRRLLAGYLSGAVELWTLPST